MREARRPAHFNTRRRIERIEGVEIVCKSQVKNDFINKLKKNKRYDRFLALVQLCAERDYTIEKLVNTIKYNFRYYVDMDELTVDMFEDIMRTEADIADAWSFGSGGSDLADVMIKNNAIEIAVNTDDIEVIGKYREIYGDTVEDKDNYDKINLNITVD